MGLISDTHGLLRPQALAALQGCAHIIHGGDIGHEGILQQLRAIAPLTVVRGNNDTGEWAGGINETETIALDGVKIYVIHDVKELAVDPVAEGIGVVVSGHSHKPKVEPRGCVLYVNPGSAGPRRFKLPVSVGELVIEGGKVAAGILALQA
ncbi:MAG: YfcE family phosphodiesterase [Ramlibacter sp.]|nr:YfcE family phosphodiesterase [Ramlibacter sp.]